MLVACADDEPSATRAAIKGGQVATGDPAVVALVERLPLCGAAPTVICTGTVIGPRAVLTATHCVDGAASSSLAVVSEPSVQVGSALIEVVGLYVHPDYDGFEPDVAVVALASEHPATPVPMREAVIDASLVGTDVRIVGYGLDDQGNLGVKREGIAVVSEVEPVSFVIAPNPAMSCGGDSGGPAFTDDGTGEVVAGITSFGDPGCAISGTYARVDLVASTFVAGALADIATRPTTPERPVPEPGVDYCGDRCESDADCPRATSCVQERCALTGGDVGVFGDSCTAEDAAACGDGVCFAGIGTGACQCFTRCELIAEPPDEGCDCAAGGQGGGASAVLLVLGWLLWPARSRWSARS